MSHELAPTRKGPVLIVDDEQAILDSLRIMLKFHGITDVETCTNGSEVMPVIEAIHPSLVLLDLALPEVSGEQVLDQILEEHPGVPVIVVTGDQRKDTMVQCIRRGAFDFLVKPVDADRLFTCVFRAEQFRRLQQEADTLRKQFLHDGLAHPAVFADLVTRHATMEKVFQYIETIAETDEPVLITGETGTGKELVARVVHRLSGRSGPLVCVNLAGLDDNVFSDTLFGHRRGAFTGAGESRAGLVEQARDGSLMLDEIGDLSPASQVKLLRLLQEHEYLPLGADTPEKTNARIIVVTQQDLESAVDGGAFRRDLYYRLNHHRVRLPALRDRMETDLALLVNHFVKKSARKLGRKAPLVPRELVTQLSTYPFPGNVRELETMIMDAVSRERSSILSLKPIRERLAKCQRKTLLQELKQDLVFPPVLPSIKECTELLVQEAMRRSEGNQTIAAGLLGISQQALSRRLKKQP